LYWSFGMDPTKLRVSSEALLRRIVNGLNLWRVSNIVDIVNLASAHHKIPIGLIDISKIQGSLQVRQAKPDEVFTRIGGETKVCRGREIVLADEEKIVCFGYATHDSDHAKVTSKSKSIYVVMYGSPEVSMDYLETSTYDTLLLMKKWIRCKPIGIRYIQC
ncbi:MAG: B3/4 domain-containing protein, partial [Candidatus Thorarchaeota archaeon]